jgi:hypothetical protein
MKASEKVESIRKSGSSPGQKRAGTGSHDEHIRYSYGKVRRAFLAPEQLARTCNRGVTVPNRLWIAAPVYSRDETGKPNREICVFKEAPLAGVIVANATVFIFGVLTLTWLLLAWGVTDV